MCGDCGCQEENAKHFPQAKIEPEKTSIHLEKNILAKNDHIAGHNQEWFLKNKIKAINLMSSPGAGKTSLLEQTVRELSGHLKMSILVGDQQTDNDANRLQAVGANVRQISTHSSCHLDAAMIRRELDHFVTPPLDLLIIENVGNLVCPAAFNLGEHHQIALLSCTEGEDKPIKYPVLFHKASVILLTKMDLAPYLDWDEKRCLDYIRTVNPHATVIKLSTKTGVGLGDWFTYLKDTVCA